MSGSLSIVVITYVSPETPCCCKTSDCARDKSFAIQSRVVLILSSRGTKVTNTPGGSRFWMEMSDKLLRFFLLNLFQKNCSFEKVGSLIFNLGRELFKRFRIFVLSRIELNEWLDGKYWKYRRDLLGRQSSIETRDSIVSVDPFLLLLCHPPRLFFVKDYSLIGSLWIPPLWATFTSFAC